MCVQVLGQAGAGVRGAAGGVETLEYPLKEFRFDMSSGSHGRFLSRGGAPFHLPGFRRWLLLGVQALDGVSYIIRHELHFFFLI